MNATKEMYQAMKVCVFLRTKTFTLVPRVSWSQFSFSYSHIRSWHEKPNFIHLLQDVKYFDLIFFEDYKL